MEQEITQELIFEVDPIRYTYFFCDEITVDTVQNLINILMNYSSVDLFVDTPGGSLHAMSTLLHFINNNHPDIKIFLTGCVASAGTLLLMDCSKEVILTEDLDCLLFHLADRGREGEFRKTTFNWNILQEQLKEWNSKFVEKFIKLGLNKKEIKEIMDGKDVLFYRKDFSRLKINKK